MEWQLGSSAVGTAGYGDAEIHDDWVEVSHEDASKQYCWNRRTDVTSGLLPADAYATWVQYLDMSGKVYCWDRRSSATSRELPPLCHSSCRGTARLDAVAPGHVGSAANSPLAHRECEERLPSADGWVEVFGGNPSVHYFWNHKAGLSVDRLPSGAKASWRAYTTSEGHWYYDAIGDASNGMQTVWELPGRASAPSGRGELAAALKAAPEIAEWLDYDAPVVLTGLQVDRRFNGQVGQIIDCDSSRCHVQLPEPMGGAVLAVQLRNLKPLDAGTIVMLQGLSQEALNEQVGTVVAATTHGQCRYSVKLSDGTLKSVRPTKVRARCRLWEIDFSKQEDQLRWKAEQQCLFIDHLGEHRKYYLHLPIGFRRQCATSAGKSQPKRWPLIIYMHGAGGGSLFTTGGKKAIATPGLQFAAQNFVVVSPRCEWSWKGSPSTWILDIVRTLSALEWVDHTRIYLTGCSMGGMGTWEVAAQDPGLFAAIAPVASHHKKDQEMWLVSSLSETSTLVVHSASDETCPQPLEEPLWCELEKCSKDFHKLVLHNVDHCAMHGEVYGRCQVLYDFLLERRSTGGG